MQQIIYDNLSTQSQITIVSITSSKQYYIAKLKKSITPKLPFTITLPTTYTDAVAGTGTTALLRRSAGSHGGGPVAHC